MSQTRSRERAERDVRSRRVHACLSAGGSLSQNRTSICCPGPQGPSQKIELAFSASPETIRRSLRSTCLLRSAGYSAGPGSLRFDDPDFVFAGRFLRCPGLPLLCGDKFPILPIHGQRGSQDGGLAADPEDCSDRFSSSCNTAQDTLLLFHHHWGVMPLSHTQMVASLVFRLRCFPSRRFPSNVHLHLRTRRR
jgi:hypothetical protein